MIITEEKNKRVIRSHDFKEVNCTIDAEDMRYVASLLRNNYSNTRLAVVREISANALDANAEANSSRKIEIKLPTKMNATFAVRDFGGGLSQEDIFGLYSKYGKSTKRDSNNYIGAFGIGKFAPLSYGENFTCVSYHCGEKISYNVFVDESDDTKIVKLHEELSSEPSGLSIEVAVSDDDISEFREVIQKFFQFFSDEEMPEFIGAEENFIEKREKVLKSKSDSWFILEEAKSYYSRNESHILMGRVSYPLDRHSINVENFVKDEVKKNIVENILSMDGFYLRVPLGSVKLHHSRESLEYNKSTQEKIVSSLLVAVVEIQKIAKEKLQDSEDLWEAKQNYASIVNAMPYNMRNIFENSFEWNDIKIDAPHFNRDYKFQDDLIITHSWKESDAESRNGFKIRSQKCNKAICQDNYLFLIQDLESAHGNNLRVRTLMNDDDSLEGVYIIHPKSQVAEDEVWNEWELGRVNDAHIKYTSNVVKEKPQRSGVRKVNGSRANIPLFVMSQERHCYKNSQYWENASSDIDSVEEDASEIEGSWNGKLIYVPIKNYKIDMDEFEDLSAMKNRFERIRERSKDESGEKNLKLFGVRAGDVKKLDDSVWVNFLDFYKEHSREVVLENLEESSNCNTSKEISSSKNYNDLTEFSGSLGSLFENNQFKLKLHKSHKISVAKNLWIELFDRNSDLRELVTFLRLKDSDWLKENLKEVISCENFVTMLEEIKSKYGMLACYGKEIGSWSDLKPEVMNHLSEYISLCDKCGDEV